MGMTLHPARLRSLCKKILQTASLLTLLGGCSGPSRSEVCSGCTGESREACDDSYDQCERISNCKKKDLKKAWADGACQYDFEE